MIKINQTMIVKFDEILFVIKFVFIFIVFTPSCKIDNSEYEKALLTCQTSQAATATTPIRFKMDKDCLNGVKLTSFEATDLQGRKINNKNLKGKYFLLNFWFIECPPCIEEMPLLNNITTTYSDKIELISVCRNKRSDIESFLSNNKINFAIIPDGENLLENVFKNPFGYPLTFLVNDKGIILQLYFGLREGTPDYIDLISRIETIE